MLPNNTELNDLQGILLSFVDFLSSVFNLSDFIITDVLLDSSPLL